MSTTVFVTGSSRGIGRAIAEAFCKMGCNVAINGANTDRLARTEYELSRINDKLIAVAADMSQPEQAEAAYKLIAGCFGGIDVLVNNAAVSYIGLFNEMKPNQWRQIIDVNINAMLNCTHQALPYMIHNKKGNIINISSVWGERGASCEAVYSLTKGAVNGFTKALAKELAPSYIRVNAIACGVIDTDMNGFLTPDERLCLEDNIGLGRFGEAEEVADLAVFLASEKSSYITGQIITIDGGMA